MLRCHSWLLLTLLAAGVASAQGIAARDLNPLLIGFELPPTLSAEQPNDQFSLSAAIGNISLNQTAGNEHLQLDAEVQQWQFSWNRRLSQSLSIQIDIPYLRISGGMLDSFIENWHRTFGLPNGNRATWPQNRLWISYDDNDERLLQQQTTQQQFGDPSLRLGWHSTSATQAYVLWLSIKLPAGNAANFTGSGTTDVALSLSTRQRLGSRVQTYQQLSVTRLGQGERLATLQRSTVFSGLLGVNLQLGPHWQALAQVDGHSAIYDSHIRALGNSLQLSFGPQYEGQHWQAGFYLSEDIAVDTAPDIQMQLTVAKRY